MAPKGVEELYQRYSPELVRFAAGIVGASDAPDAVAAVFARMLASRRTAPIDNPRAYLYRSVLNECASIRRRLSRHFRLRDAEVLVEATEGIDPSIARAIARLSPRQQAVVLLTYWYDLDAAAVSERLGLTVGSTKKHLERAREKLKRDLSAGSPAQSRDKMRGSTHGH